MTSVFLSYASADVAIVEKAHAALEQSGFDVWRDRSRLEADWSREIAHALIACDIVCVFWSLNSAKSSWVRHEWLTARAIGKHVAICFVDRDVPLPTALETLHGQSIEDSDLASHLHAIANERASHDYTITPARTHVPLRPSPVFVGRDDDLVELYLRIVAGLSQRGTTRVGLTGMPGIGKTQLAIEFVHRFAFAFPGGVAWIDAARPDTWSSSIARFARTVLRLEPIEASETEDPRTGYVEAFRSYCATESTVLLVFDNVIEPADLDNPTWLDGVSALALGCNVLFTTRDRLKLPGVEYVDVQSITEAAAFEILASSRQPVGDEESVAIEICRLIHGHPLALTLAASHLRTYSETSYRDYHESLEARRLDTIDSSDVTAAELSTAHEPMVAITLESHLRNLRDDFARSVLEMASLLPEAAPIPKARLRLLCERGEDEDQLVSPVSRALKRLVQVSLVDEAGAHRESVRVHPLVAALVSAKTSEIERTRMTARASAAVGEAYRDDDKLLKHCQRRGVDEVIEDLRLAVDWSPGDDSGNELRILHRTLDRERTRLESDGESIDAVGFTQQLHLRAASLEPCDLAKRFARQLLKCSREPVFVVAAVSERESFEWSRRFVGHKGYVQAVSISADGRTLLSGSDDRTAIVWDAERGHPIHRFTEHEHQVQAVALRSDGEVALTGDVNGELFLWECRTGEVQWHLPSNESWVSAAHLYDDGRRALVGTHNGDVRLWDVESRDLVCEVSAGREHRLDDARLSQDGRNIFGSMLYGGFIVWDVDTQEVVQRVQDDLNVHIGECGIALGQSVTDDSLTRWSLRTATATVDLPGTGMVTKLAFSPDGTLAVTDWEGDLGVWDLVELRMRGILSGGPGEIMCLAVAQDGRHVVAGKDNDTLTLWDLESPLAPPTELTYETRLPYLGLAWSSDSERAAANRDTKAVTWLSSSSEPLSVQQELEFESSYDTLNPFDGRGIALSADGNLLAAGAFDYFRLWRIPTGEKIRDIAADGWVEALAISPDGKRVYAAAGSIVTQWDIGSEAPIAEYDIDENVNGMSLSSAGDRILIGAHSDVVLWEVGKPEPEQRLQGHDFVVWVGFAPGNEIGVSADMDGLMILWDLTRGIPVRQISCGTQPLGGTFVNGGQHIATIDWERNLWLWNARTGACERRVRLEAIQVAIAAKGNRILLSDENGLLRVLDLRVG